MSLVLIVVFYMVFSTLRLFLFIFRKDVLGLNIDKKKRTYWK
jgi:hypothetical protein